MSTSINRKRRLGGEMLAIRVRCDGVFQVKEESSATVDPGSKRASIPPISNLEFSYPDVENETLS